MGDHLNAVGGLSRVLCVHGVASDEFNAWVALFCGFCRIADQGYHRPAMGQQGITQLPPIPPVTPKTSAVLREVMSNSVLNRTDIARLAG